MTLTEQWKKGELSVGCYYIKDINDEIFADYYVNNGFRNGFEDFFDDEIKEVLAPVPSYEEWQDTENRSLLTAEFSNEIDELNEEIQQLKELLKECREILEDITEHTDYNEVGIENLLTKIDNAIGEKK